MPEETQVSKVAYQRALEKRKNRSRLVECLEQKVCPLCGADLVLITEKHSCYYSCGECRYKNKRTREYPV